MRTPVVFIDGDQGTTGLQIHARLHGREDLQLLTLPEAERKDPLRRSEAINSADIALLCLPDDAAREAEPASTRSRLDLPTPLGPRMVTTSPGASCRSKRASTSCQPPSRG